MLPKCKKKRRKKRARKRDQENETIKREMEKRELEKESWRESWTKYSFDWWHHWQRMTHRCVSSNTLLLKITSQSWRLPNPYHIFHQTSKEIFTHAESGLVNLRPWCLASETSTVALHRLRDFCVQSPRSSLFWHPREEVSSTTCYQFSSTCFRSCTGFKISFAASSCSFSSWFLRSCFKIRLILAPSAKTTTSVSLFELSLQLLTQEPFIPFASISRSSTVWETSCHFGPPLSTEESCQSILVCHPLDDQLESFLVMDFFKTHAFRLLTWTPSAVS